MKGARLTSSSLKTRDLAFLTKGYVFVNIGVSPSPDCEVLTMQSAFIIIIVLLATTGRENMHPASYVFTFTTNSECSLVCYSSKADLAATGWANNGLAFMFGLLSVQWTVSGLILC
jgi:hypothetical protein